MSVSASVSASASVPVPCSTSSMKWSEVGGVAKWSVLRMMGSLPIRVGVPGPIRVGVPGPIRVGVPGAAVRSDFAMDSPNRRRIAERRAAIFVRVERDDHAAQHCSERDADGDSHRGTGVDTSASVPI